MKIFNNKPTIFITIERGLVARNILMNDFYRKLKEKYKIFIFTPLFKDQEFIDKFGGENVQFLELKKHKLTRFEAFICALHKGLVYNPTVKIKSRYGLSSKHKQKRNLKKIFKNYFEQIFLGLLLSEFKFLRDWLKIIDRLIYKKNYYKKHFDKYKPEAVFLTNISFDDEIYLLRAARANKVLNFGMTKSWDNFSKVSFRDKVDKLIVWSDYMKDEAIIFQNYKRKNIEIIGVPQFDIYSKIKNDYEKEDFTEIYNLDKNKKIILFGQGGPLLSPDDPYIVRILRDWIIKNQRNYQILIRPHLAHKQSADVFKDLIDDEIVFIDSINSPSNFSDHWDLTAGHHLRLALSMKFSDVLVSSITTLVLDALTSGNEVVCYYFDKDKNKPYGDSIKRLYETLWFLELQKYGLRKFIVHNEEELCSRIEEILKNPQKEIPEENKSIVSRFCYKIDGQSGSRLFNFINSTIKEL